MKDKQARRKEFERRIHLNNRSLDREFNGWKLIDVHEIPYPLKNDDEIDFYCYKKDMYLLRVRKSIKEQSFVVKSEGLDQLMYLVAETKAEKITNKLLEELLSEFEKFGLPDYQFKKIHSELK